MRGSHYLGNVERAEHEHSVAFPFSRKMETLVSGLLPVLSCGVIAHAMPLTPLPPYRPRVGWDGHGHGGYRASEGLLSSFPACFGVCSLQGPGLGCRGPSRRTLHSR